jgi:hypothetical protein
MRGNAKLLLSWLFVAVLFPALLLISDLILYHHEGWKYESSLFLIITVLASQVGMLKISSVVTLFRAFDYRRAAVEERGQVWLGLAGDMVLYVVVPFVFYWISIGVTLGYVLWTPALLHTYGYFCAVLLIVVLLCHLAFFLARTAEARRGHRSV